MDAIRGTIYTPYAEAQLEALVDGDIRYQLEPEQYEWVLERDPEGIGTPIVIEQEAVFVLITPQKKNGPPRLAVTYRILRDEGYIQIIDLRPMP